MGRRCNCAGTCSCVFKEGRGIQLSGEGTVDSPVRVDNGGAPTYMVGSITSTVQVQMEGSGTQADPFQVSAERFSGDARPLVYVFTVPGEYVWMKPSFGTFVRATILGAGGGGAGSYFTNGYGDGATTSLYNFGTVAMGGKPGRRLSVEQLLAELPASAAITVGAGGGGGPTQGAAGGGDGPPGGAGTASRFNGLTAQGGAGGRAAASIPSVPAFRGYADPPPSAALPGEGGMGGSGAYTWPLTVGAAGGAPAGQSSMAGWPGTYDYGVAGSAGGTSAQLLAPLGTGGGGGRGLLAVPGTPTAYEYAADIGGGAGGKGGPGAGGGGSGVSGGFSGAVGGAGGDGVVVLLVQ